MVPAVPYNVPLPRQFAKAGWRVKVFDGEGPEAPHVTIRFKTSAWWRISLRDGEFLSPGGSWSEIPELVRAAVEAHWQQLQEYWDRENPHNPVSSDADDESDENEEGE